jgi:hypothetical protein
LGGVAGDRRSHAVGDAVRMRRRSADRGEQAAPWRARRHGVGASTLWLPRRRRAPGGCRRARSSGRSPCRSVSVHRTARRARRPSVRARRCLVPTCEPRCRRPRWHQRRPVLRSSRGRRGALPGDHRPGRLHVAQTRRCDEHEHRPDIGEGHGTNHVGHGGHLRKLSRHLRNSAEGARRYHTVGACRRRARGEAPLVRPWRFGVAWAREGEPPGRVCAGNALDRVVRRCA